MDASRYKIGTRLVPPGGRGRRGRGQKPFVIVGTTEECYLLVVDGRDRSSPLKIAKRRLHQIISEYLYSEE